MRKKKTPVEFVVAGGLGNQMFMLYAGLYFQEKFNREVSFDVSDLNRISLLHPGANIHTLGLLNNDRISIKYKGRNPGNKKELSFKLFAKAAGISNRFFQRRSRRIQEVGYFDFNLIPPKIKRIEGYFQTWRYFSSLEVKPILQVESLLETTSWYNKESLLLDEKQFAAFHIRRGDYELAANRNNGILSISYFESISKQLPSDIEIIVFTDSPEVVSSELRQLGRRFRVMTPPKDSDPVESLLLMMRASHIAISNSTFSWWAATLAETNATVYAPTKWFELRDDPVDLIPDNWIKVKSDWKKQL